MGSSTRFPDGVIVAFLLLFAVGWILDRFKPRATKTEKAIEKDEIASRETVMPNPPQAISAKGAE